MKLGTIMYRGHELTCYHGIDVDPDCYWWAIDGDTNGPTSYEASEFDAAQRAYNYVDDLEGRYAEGLADFNRSGGNPGGL